MNEEAEGYSADRSRAFPVPVDAEAVEAAEEVWGAALGRLQAFLRA